MDAERVVVIREHTDAGTRDVGILRLVDGTIVAEPATPADARKLASILNSEIGWYRPGQRTIGITAVSHPKEFLEMLHMEFRGTYVRALPAKEGS